MAIKRRDIDRIYNAIRPRLNAPKSRTGSAVTGVIGAHTHSADTITSETAGDVAATDVQDAIAEIADEKLARDGSQTVTGDLDHDHHSINNVHDADIEGTATVGEDVDVVGGDVIVEAGDVVVESGNVTLQGDVGSAIVGSVRALHMAGDQDDNEALVDGLEKVQFNDEPTKSVIANPSRIEMNADVTAGADYTPAEGVVSWDDMESALISYVKSGAAVALVAFGWGVLNAINGVGGE